MTESNGKTDDYEEVEQGRPSAFFAKFLPGFNSETLRIPQGIMKLGTNRVILNSCSIEDQKWEIDIYEIGNNSIFYNGWERFVQDHDLHENDFLVFEYDGCVRFRVRVYQVNCMEKRCESVSASPLMGTKAIAARDYAVVKRKARSFNSENPSFWRLMKSYNVETNYALLIPQSMMEGLIPENTKKVSLKNSEGKAWNVMVGYNGNQYFFTTGWKSFVKENRLKVDDACIFELVGKAVFQVHVY